MTIEVLDPTYGDGRPEFRPADRPVDLVGATVGLLSNGKQGTRDFFDELERCLLDRYSVERVVRVTKSNYSAPAEAQVMDQAREWNALIAGIGD